MKPVIPILVAALAFVLMLFFLRRKQVQHNVMVRRMEFFAGNVADGKPDAMEARSLQQQVMGKVRALAQQWRRMHQNDSLDLKMQQADWPLLGSEFQVLLALASLAAGAFALVLTFDPVYFVLGMAGAAVFGMLYLKIHIASRRKAFLNQLGDTLIMVANALRAGFSFMQAMELISREMDAPIGTEFQKVINEINLGGTLETALENMGRRMESSDFELVVTAVLIQRQVGGNLSQVLDTISATINERIRMRREISALTAQGKLSGIIVGLVPPFIAGFIYTQNPDYFDPMLESPIGQALLVAALVLEILAAFVIRKIVDIDV